MSSDSDIEYESADEESSAVSEAVEKVSSVTLSDHTVPATNSDQCDKPESLRGDTSTTSDPEKVPHIASHVQKASPETASPTKDSAVDGPERLPDAIDDKGEKQDAKSTGIKPGNLGSENDDKTEVGEISNDSKKPEKQRVPLRLEKKIQQKSLSSEDALTVKSQPTESPKVSEEKSSSWGFGGWGSSLLSTAAYSVSTLTNQVSQGIGTVLETVESTLGVPPPEELAATMSKKDETSEAAEKDQDTKAEEEISEPRNSILSDVSSWTRVLENTGSKVLMGGLDTLELIGKKTIDIITEGDPGLRKKRSLFADGVTLSQILREAKTEADESTQDVGSEKGNAIHFTQFFDEYQGLVHLEALEMLSKQSEGKVHGSFMRIPKDAVVRRQLEEVKAICEDLPSLDDSTDSSENFEEFDALCKKHVLELNLPFNVENIIKTQKKISEMIENYETTNRTSVSPEEIYESAISNLAEFTAKSIETFHKLAELMLVQNKLEPNAEHLATNLTGLTNVMCIEINSLSSRYHHCLDSLGGQSVDEDNQKTNVTTIVTNLYVEASNSIKYIQDAFLLLVPVLQASVLESS